MTNTALIGAAFDGPIDIVGDIHGEIDALCDLMQRLGYDAAGVHPAGRRLVFIGDLADRGPDSPAVFARVADLVSRGLAQCILGNHELNLLRETRKPGNGWYFDDDHDIREDRFLGSRALEARDRPAIRAFLETLPLALERPDLRLVHAAWNPPSIAAVRSSRITARELYELHDRASRQRARGDRIGGRAPARSSPGSEPISRIRRTRCRCCAAPESSRSMEQLGNPVRIITSGIEKAAQRPFFANDKWRMADRVPWWDDYDEPTPVIMGHYWRLAHAVRAHGALTG